jgi:hypothetical protein
MRDPATLFVINDNDFRMPLTFNLATGTFPANPAAVSTTLGMITFTGNGLDPSDQDGVNAIAGWPVEGAYQSDAISSFASGGQTYFVAANEGDSREWGTFVDIAAVSTFNLDRHVFPGGAWLKGNTRLGRLQARKDLGDLDGDGDFDRIVPLGARSFTIWNAAGGRVWDSGDFLEQHTKSLYPNNFNASNTNNTRDNRSRSKGPEPEGVTTGAVNGRNYMFGICERVGGVFAFSLDNPAAPAFEAYINSRNFSVATGTAGSGDLGPEGVSFVPAADSPSGKALLLVAHEISGTLAIYEVAAVCDTLGDINADCVVAGDDLGQLLNNWGGSGVGDLNADGTVGADDLAILLNNWG